MLQKRQQFVTDAIASESRAGVARILSPGKPADEQIIDDLTAIDFDERPDHLFADDRADARQPGPGSAPQDAVKHGLRLVRPRVAGGDAVDRAVGDRLAKERQPRTARRLLQIVSAGGNLPFANCHGQTQFLGELAHEYRALNWPKPVFELALRWLRDHDPGPPEVEALVHGDFRHGNLIIGPDGVRAVLDWELAHTGDPMEDLGWVCVNSWRFGEIDKPVGGFGSREELYAGYAEAGRKADPERAKFWEVMGTLRWGVMCCGMMQRFRKGPEHSMERAMIGRRASETEIDLLRLLAPRGGENAR